MALHATESLGDALDATKELLVPFDGGAWLRIAVMAFFIGGLGAPTVGPNVRYSGDPSEFQVEEIVNGSITGVGLSLTAIAAIVAAVVSFALLLLYIGSVMEFVLVETLRTREASVRDRFRAFGGLGARLFGFRLVLFVLTAAMFGAIVFPAVFTGSLVWLVLLVPVIFFVVPVVAVVHGFTNVFVVPVMLHERCGVLAGWRRFAGAARGHLDEFGVYLVLSIILSWVGSLLVGIVGGVIGLLLLLPIGIAAWFAFLSGGPVALVVLVPLLLVAFLFLLAVGAVVQVPVLTYLRYYALFVLGGATEYDLVDDVRREIHATPGDDGRDDPDPGDLS
jgi:hypothetical protein